jgi:uncharacterized protein
MSCCGETTVGDDPTGLVLDWPGFAALTCALSGRVRADGPPDVLVGVLRGGMIPAVVLAHALGLRTVRAVEVIHTTTNGVNATKTAHPMVTRAETLGDVAGLDVLVVDDIAGTGDTMITTATLARQGGAARVRTLACVVNAINWRRARTEAPDELLTYLGSVVEGWVIFPWESH